MYWKTRWKRCLYEGSTGVRVLDNRWYRWLQFDSDAVQSLLSKRNPSTPALHYLRIMACLAQTYPGDTLLLGLGGAGMVHALNAYLQDFSLDVVECSEEVITLARQFFRLSDLTLPLTLYLQDASEFVHQATRQWSYVLVDVFNAKHFPPSCLNPVFFADCQRLLTPQGVLLINIANADDQLALFGYVHMLFQGRTLLIPVKDSPNVILLAAPEAGWELLFERIPRLIKGGSFTWDSRWGRVYNSRKSPLSFI